MYFISLSHKENPNRPSAPIHCSNCRCWSSALKLEAVCSSEMLVSTYKSTCEDQPQHLHHRKNLKAHSSN
jgi:hypothetical protein